MLIHYIGKYKFRCIFYLLMLIGSTVAYARLVVNVSYLFDSLAKFDIAGIIPLFTILFFALLIIRLVDYWADVLCSSTLNQIRADMKNDLFSCDINRDDMEAISRDSGEYVADYTNDITMIEAKGFRALKEMAAHIVSILTFSTTLYTIEHAMLIPVAVNILLAILIPVATSRKTAAKMNLFLKRFDYFVQHMDDYFSGFALLKSFGAEKSVADRFRTDNAETEDLKLRAECRIETINAVITAASWAMQIAIIVIGFAAALNGRLSTGSVIAAYTLAGSLCSPLQSMVRNYNEICSIRGIETRLQNALRARKGAVKTPEQPAPAQAVLELRHIHVILDGQTILNDISTVFEPGKKYLIIGENGSGKTTLMKTLKRTVPLSSGEIRINGQELNSLTADQLGRIISYSNERVNLFSGSAEDNLVLFREADAEAVRSAAEQAQFMLPLERSVGNDGTSLSSGEKRRLEIARSILYGAPVFIFDEVISTLDIKTAYDIEKLVLSLPNHTVIMVSNSFSGKLIREYDQIIVMDSGRIAGQGTHDELMKSCPIYRQIYHIRCGHVPVEEDRKIC